MLDALLVGREGRAMDPVEHRLCDDAIGGWPLRLGRDGWVGAAEDTIVGHEAWRVVERTLE